MRRGWYLDGRSDSGLYQYVETDPTGRYGRFEEVLGKGATKTVYLAFDEVFGMEVAWNQAPICDVMQSPEALQRLYSEVKLLSNLDHDSIIRFHASWVNIGNRTFNFVTELFTSGTLREYRNKYHRLDIRAVKNWARQILHGLIYLHNHEPPVIHRDLKCDNIFVNGHLAQVKIGDLGLAAILWGSRSAHSVIGTPEFMAPELYEEEYNELVDIYSFGMCVLEMLTAEYPYSECSNPAQIYKKVTSGKLPAAFHRMQDPEAKRFIGRCLETASKRSSAKELVVDTFLSSEDGDSLPIVKKTNENLGGHPHFLVACSNFNMKSTDTRITGKMNPEDNAIFLKVQFADKDGHSRNIYFPFDIINDTPLDVANEMVKELEITDREPSQIDEMITKEILALVPHWEKGGTSRNHHIYTIDDEDVGIHHPFYYLSSPSTSSQCSEFSQDSTHAHYHHQLELLTDRLQDDMFLDEDTSSLASTCSDGYSNVTYNSSNKQEVGQCLAIRESQPFEQNHKPSRFCAVMDASADHLLAANLHNQCNVTLESPQGSNRRGKKPIENCQMSRNRSLLDMRSQLLHRSLLDKLKRRVFNTIGAIENNGFGMQSEASSKESLSCGASKRKGLTWRR